MRTPLLLAALCVCSITLNLSAETAYAQNGAATTEQDIDKIGNVLADPKRWIPIELARFNQTLTQTLHDDSKNREFIARHPEMEKQLIAVLNGRISVLMEQELPTMKTDFKNIVRQGMTTSQIRTFAAFVESSFGKHMMGLVASQAAGSATPPVQEPSAADRKVAMAFVQSGGQAKLELIGRQIEAARDRWFASFHETHFTELNNLAVSETEALIAKLKPERAVSSPSPDSI